MRLLRLLPLSLLLAVALLAAGCGSSKKSVPADAIAVVGNDTITKAQFNALIAGAQRNYKVNKKAFPKPGTAPYKSIQDQAVQYLVQEDELGQRAKELSITITPKEVAARLKQIKAQYFGGSEKTYKAQLKAQGLTQAQVEQDLYAQILSEKLYNKITASVKVGDADVKSYYVSHQSTYYTAASRDVRHILVNNKTLADQIETQLKSGGDFAKLAKKYSKDPGSAAKGGKLTITKGQTVAAFDKEAFALKTGDTSAPVHTQYGWHIIQALSAVRPAKQTPLASVKDSIRQQLLQSKKTTVMTNWVNKLKKDFAKKIAYGAGYEPAATSTSTTATATTTG
ncbi:MAG TPA: peptidylprolyl isomerase [Gaiellaceae bacterium]|jgi:parvulin-like peptidyl-prolyl isomerase|nr:peptidylprolyl isomerase [Gaiellaceae bacterium]